MFVDASVIEALTIVAGVGAIAGLLGGFVANADSLFGAIFMGIVGSVSLATILRIANAPSIYSVGDDFSLVWGALGGLLLGYVVGRSNV